MDFEQTSSGLPVEDNAVHGWVVGHKFINGVGNDVGNVAVQASCARARSDDTPQGKWFFSHYVPNGQRNDWRVSPILGKLSQLPPALVVTAQFDPLHDEGAEYAKRLQAAGVSTHHIDVDGVVHEFFGLAGLVKPAKDTLDKTAVWLKQVWSAEASD